MGTGMGRMDMVGDSFVMECGFLFAFKFLHEVHQVIKYPVAKFLWFD